MLDLPPLNIITILDLLGTLAFAISGVRMAAKNDFDLFGAYVIGLITAIGGGTTRDLLLNQTPFWMEDARYLIITGVALVFVLTFKRKLIKLGNTLFLFDTIGLGLFTVSGIEKSYSLGFPIWVCIIMGTITGSVGGVIRDVIINEVPLLFRKNFYAMASVIGGLAFFICLKIEVLSSFNFIISAASIILIRIIAVKFKLQLPIMRSVD